MFYAIIHAVFQFCCLVLLFMNGNSLSANIQNYIGFDIIRSGFFLQYWILLLEQQDFLFKLGKLLRVTRERKNISQTELALRVDLTQPRLAKIESGQVNTSVYVLYKLSIELEIDLISEIKKISN